MDLHRSGKDTAKCAWSSSRVHPQPLIFGLWVHPSAPCSKRREREVERGTQQKGVTSADVLWTHERNQVPGSIAKGGKDEY